MRKLAAAIYLVCLLVFCAGTNDLMLLGAGVSGSSAVYDEIGGVTGWDVIVRTANDSPSTAGILKTGPAAASYTDTIVTWEDQTTNGYDLTAAGVPVYLEDAASTFDGPDLDGASDYFAETSNAAGEFERTDKFFGFVVAVPDVITGTHALISKNDGAGATDYRGWILYQDSATLRLALTSLNSSNVAAVGSSAAQFVADTLRLYSFYYDGSSTAAGMTLYVNGSAIAISTSANTLSATILNTSDFEIGSRTAGAIPFNGTILKAGIVKGARSGAEIAAIHSELTAEFGL